MSGNKTRPGYCLGITAGITVMMILLPVGGALTADDSRASLNEPTDNIAVVEAGNISNVKAGISSVYTMRENKTPIVSISFETVKNPYASITIRVQELRDTSIMVNGTLPHGIIYKNININIGIRDYDISDGLILFRVENAWMRNEKVIPADIMLYRGAVHDKRETGWMKLKTTELYKEGGFTYFESNTPGFSPFIIIAKSPEKVEKESNKSLLSLLLAGGLIKDTPEAMETAGNEANKTEDHPSDSKPPDPKFRIGLGLIGIASGIIGIGAYSYRRIR